MSAEVFQAFLSEHRITELGYNNRIPAALLTQICTFHVRASGESEWKQRGYPIIDWEQLETIRIPEHIPYLSTILHESTPSFYRDAFLDGSGTSGRERQRYLNEGIFAVVKSGYFGGLFGDMVNVILGTMSLEIRQSLMVNQNEHIRLMGVSAYVQAILGPELLLRLVKEDMRVRTDEEARQILTDSDRLGHAMFPS